MSEYPTCTCCKGNLVFTEVWPTGEDYVYCVNCTSKGPVSKSFLGRKQARRQASLRGYNSKLMKSIVRKLARARMHIANKPWRKMIREKNEAALAKKEST